jgi:uncharacterized membrane protein
VPKKPLVHSKSCSVCQQSFPLEQLVPLELLRRETLDLLRQDKPHIKLQGHICHKDLETYRALWAASQLKKRHASDRTFASVISSFTTQNLIARNIHQEAEQQYSLGDRLADKIAEFGGSWRFIILFGLVIASWIGLNSLYLLGYTFDPYPYILLNLLLSCLAAIQAPIIMMSQNRQEARDRMRAEHDYEINLKAEIEIRYLTTKIDHFSKLFWEKLKEIEQKVEK